VATYEGKLTAKGAKFAIVAGRFNEFITSKLISGAIDALVRHEADESDIDIYRVPGSWEIPVAALRVARSGKYDAVICVATVIRGGTVHFNYIAAEVSKGIAQVALATDVPTTFGVITADTLEQAIDRAGAKQGNKGAQAAMAAIEMVDLFRRMG